MPRPSLPFSHARAVRLVAFGEFLTAGLGILGGKSPHAAVNIGQGGLQGLRTYETLQQEANQQEEKESERTDTGNYRKATLDQQAKRLSDAADEARQRIANESTRTGIAQQQADETAAYHKGELGIDQGKLDQGKFQLVPGYGQDEHGNQVPGAYRFDPKTGEIKDFQAGVMPGRGGLSGGATNQLIQELIRSGAAANPADALKIIRDPTSKNAAAAEAARERLAQGALKNDPEALTDPKGRLDAWRQYYGIGQAPAPPTTSPAPASARPASAPSAAPAASQAPAHPPIPDALSKVPGLLYNPARQQWRDPTTGTIYDATGAALRQ